MVRRPTDDEASLLEGYPDPNGEHGKGPTLDELLLVLIPRLRHKLHAYARRALPGDAVDDCIQETWVAAAIYLTQNPRVARLEKEAERIIWGIIRHKVPDFYRRGPNCTVRSFSIAPAFAEELNRGQISRELQAQFQEYSRPLSTSARVRVDQAGNKWTIKDVGTQYYIRGGKQVLDVYTASRLAEGISLEDADRQGVTSGAQRSMEEQLEERLPEGAFIAEVGRLKGVGYFTKAELPVLGLLMAGVTAPRDMASQLKISNKNARTIKSRVLEKLWPLGMVIFLPGLLKLAEAGRLVESEKRIVAAVMRNGFMGLEELAHETGLIVEQVEVCLNGLRKKYNAWKKGHNSRSYK